MAMSVCECVSPCVCVFVCNARKTSRKMRFLCGRRGASGASKNYHDRRRLQISFKISLSSIRKKKNASKKVCIFQIVFESLSLDCKRYSWLFKFLLVNRTIKGYFL